MICSRLGSLFFKVLFSCEVMLLSINIMNNMHIFAFSVAIYKQPNGI